MPDFSPVILAVDGIGWLMVASDDAPFNKHSVITRFLENGTPINITMHDDSCAGDLAIMRNPEGNASQYPCNALEENIIRCTGAVALSEFPQPVWMLFNQNRAGRPVQIPG